MEIVFKKIDVESHFDTCLKFREELFVSEFGSDYGFSQWADRYKNKMSSRIDKDQWFYIHVWESSQIIGQLEFRSFSKEQHVGYIHFFFVIKELRGSEAAKLIHRYVVEQMSRQGCNGAVLSVNHLNARALAFYKRLGWKFICKNPKYEKVDYYRLNFG